MFNIAIKRWRLLIKTVPPSLYSRVLQWEIFFPRGSTRPLFRHTCTFLAKVNLELENSQKQVTSPQGYWGRTYFHLHTRCEESERQTWTGSSGQRWRHGGGRRRDSEAVRCLQSIPSMPFIVPVASMNMMSSLSVVCHTSNHSILPRYVLSLSIPSGPENCSSRNMVLWN